MRLLSGVAADNKGPPKRAFSRGNFEDRPGCGGAETSEVVMPRNPFFTLFDIFECFLKAGRCHFPVFGAFAPTEEPGA